MDDKEQWYQLNKDSTLENSNMEQNIYLDSNLSPISLGDDSGTVLDLNDTTMLLQRAHEANNMLSVKDGDSSIKDVEWHSLQSSIMQEISRPEPLGYAKDDAGNITANRSVKFANELSLDTTDIPVSEKNDEFTPLQIHNISLNDESNFDDLPCESGLNKKDLNSRSQYKANPSNDVGDIHQNLDHKNVSAQNDRNLSKPMVSEAKYDYIRNDMPSSSQSSDMLFVPSFTQNQSLSDSLFLQSLSETSNALKADIQKILSKKIPQSFGNTQNDLLNVTDFGAEEIDNASIDATLRKKLAFSAKKKYAKDDSTNISKNKSLSSYSFSSSLTSTLGSGNFCIRKVVDEKIEICRKNGDDDDLLTTDSTLTSSMSVNNVGIMPQFNLTSLSSVGEKTSNLNSEEGTIPSCPSSFSDPSFHNIAAKQNSPVSKLLGSSFKKTEHFLKKLKKLELPYMGDIENVIVKSHIQEPSKVDDDIFDENTESNFTPLANFNDSDCEVLELSDNEILFEQDIKSASLVDPYISDSIIQSCSKDISLTTQLYPSKMGNNNNATSEENSLLTDLEEDKTIDSSMIPKDKSPLPAAYPPNLETIIELNSPEKVIAEVQIRHSVSDDTDTSSQAGTPTPIIKNRRSNQRKSRNEILSDTASSNDSERLNRKIRRFEKLQKQRNLKNQQMKKREMLQSSKDVYKRNLHQDENLNQRKNRSDLRIINSAPSEFSVLKPTNNNCLENSSTDEYMNLKQENKSQKSAYRSHSSHKSNENDVLKHKNSFENLSKEYSRNELLESSLNTLLHEYEKPISGKFSESPLIKKLELLSKILREAKLKRYNSYLSDASGASISSISHNETPISSRPLAKPDSSPDLGKDRTSLEKNDKVSESSIKSSDVITKNSIKSNDAITKVSSCSTRSSKNVVCPNCCKRDVSTNCPTPCVSSDESSVKSKPLTLMTWTQTNNHNDITIIEPISRKNAPRKRWSDKEDSEDIEVEGGATKDEPGIINGNRERRNTFVLEDQLNDLTLDSNESKGKGSTAWFLSFNSEDSESRPISTIPDLNTAYLGSKKDDQDCITHPRSNAQLGLREAFQLHKKEFIKGSNERLQGVKDVRLRQNHPRKVLKMESTKRAALVVEVQGVKKVKKKMKIQKPKEITIKNTWVPKMFTYQELNENKVRQLRANRQKMKNYDVKIRKRLLTPTSPLNLQKNVHFVERH